MYHLPNRVFFFLAALLGEPRHARWGSKAASRIPYHRLRPSFTIPLNPSWQDTTSPALRSGSPSCCYSPAAIAGGSMTSLDPGRCHAYWLKFFSRDQFQLNGCNSELYNTHVGLHLGIRQGLRGAPGVRRGPAEEEPKEVITWWCAGHPKVARLSVLVVVTASIAFSILATITVMAPRYPLSTLYTSSTMVIEAVISLTLSIFLSGIQLILSGVAVGSGWQVIVAYVNVGAYYLIGLPIGCVLGFKTSLGAAGIWWGLIIGVAMQTLALIVITVRTNWDSEVEKAIQRLRHTAAWWPPSANV